MRNYKNKSVFSIDVEEWFNISNISSEPEVKIGIPYPQE